MSVSLKALLKPAVIAALCGIVAGILIVDARSLGIAIASAVGALYAGDVFAELARTLEPSTESERRIVAAAEQQLRTPGDVG